MIVTIVFKTYALIEFAGVTDGRRSRWVKIILTKDPVSIDILAYE